ncbi:MAG: glycosyltransferase family 2 protein [Myxococcaceae bacterium]|nr:glycosyltransferase family 2 protein [Myxococcaceae bacterium]
MKSPEADPGAARAENPNPAVSIVVPIYNGAQHLRETLRSLLTQTFDDFELIAVDDGSSDNSVEIVRSIGDSRVRLIRQENRGLAHTLNAGIEAARALLIARSDQDDISRPDRIARQVEVMRNHPDAIAAFSYHSKIGSARGWMNADKYRMQEGALKEFDPWRDGCLLGSTMIARTSVLRDAGGFRQEFYPSDDWDLELRLAERGKVLVIEEPLIAYRFHGGANTYRVYAVMQHKRRWAEECSRCRLAHLPEPTFEQFLDGPERTVWVRLRQYRKDLAKLQMRLAGQAFLDGRLLPAAARASFSALLQPTEAVRRLQRVGGALRSAARRKLGLS